MKFTKDLLSLSLNRSDSVLSSQEQAAQIHSGHHRVNSSYFLPSVLESELVIQTLEDHQMATENYDMSDITTTIRTSSEWSNIIQGKNRIVFKNTQNMI